MRMTGLLVLLFFIVTSEAFAQNQNTVPAACSAVLKLDSSDDYVRLSVFEKLIGTIKAQAFTQKELQFFPLDDVEQVAIGAYSFGFLTAQSTKDVKTQLLQKVAKEMAPTLDNLSPSAKATAEPWFAKLTAMVSKAFDQGKLDGSKPCPR